MKKDNSVENLNKTKSAYTMAEVLISIIVLGTVSALVIPGVVRQRTEKINRVKLRRAISTYDLFINSAITVEGLPRSVDELDKWGSQNSCENSRKYFKISSSKADKCKFRTADGTWWNLSKPSKTMVAFKEGDLTVKNAESQTSYKAFYLVTRFDNGIERIVDVNYGMKKADYSMLANSAKVRAYLEQKEIIDYYNFCPAGCWANNCAPSCVRIMGDGACGEYYDETGQRLYQVCGCKSRLTDCDTYKAFIPEWNENYSNCEYKNQGDTFKSCTYGKEIEEGVIESYSGCKQNAGESHEGCTNYELRANTDYGKNITTCNLKNNTCSYTRQDSKDLPSNIISIDSKCKSDFSTGCKVSIVRFKDNQNERTFDFNDCEDTTPNKCKGCYARKESCPPKDSNGYYIVPQ